VLDCTIDDLALAIRSDKLRAVRNPHDQLSRSARFPAGAARTAMREVLLSVDKRPLSGADTRAWQSGGIAARHVPLPSRGYDYAWQGKTHYLALHDLQLKDGELFTDTMHAHRTRELRGTLTFLPAQSRVWGWAAPASAHNSFTAVYFDPGVMDDDIARRFRGAALAPHLHFTNPALFATLAKLRAALCGPGDTDPVYLESLSVLCALEVCQFLHGRHDTGGASPGRLPPRQQQRLFDYVEAHLPADIGLEDLARVVGLSRFHLIRTFKATTGMTPYHYLLTRRIERACVLLREGRLTIEAVARKVGFRSASHFIRRFRQLNGTTPSAYAREMGADVGADSRAP
jgi:AraC family transcriptional regulator